MLKIYNSLTQNKDEFIPRDSGKVGMYVCGMTVYDDCHLGHARSLILFDVIVNYLRFKGYEVNYVRNITDIDDKIIRRAQEKEIEFDALTAMTIDSMHADERALGITPPNHEPCATEYIAEIIDLIQALIDKGSAYVIDSGDVCFSIETHAEYGKLSHRDIDKLIAGSRIEVGSGKKNPLDFVLWKMAKPNEPSWSSPWGQGRPGWHIECSAMSTTLLGKHFDIHGGGMDLKFPHHENEIAQSEMGYGCQFANYWMHVGLLQINREKMSKSLGNFLTIKDVLARYHPEVIRYFMLSSQYRSPVNYSDEVMEQMREALEGLYIALRDLPQEPEFEEVSQPYEIAFQLAMDDDFNTPKGLAVLFDLAKQINRVRTSDAALAAQLAATLRRLGDVLGLLRTDPTEFLQRGFDVAQVDEIDGLIKAREKARADKEWQKADEYRDALLALGVELEDAPGGTIWRKRNDIAPSN